MNTSCHRTRRNHNGTTLYGIQTDTVRVGPGDIFIRARHGASDSIPPARLLTQRSECGTSIVSRSFPDKWRVVTNCSNLTSPTHMPSRLSMIRLARSSRSTNERDDSAKRRTGLPATKPAMAGRTKPERLEKAPEGELFLFKLGEMK